MNPAADLLTTFHPAPAWTLALPEPAILGVISVLVILLARLRDR